MRRPSQLSSLLERAANDALAAPGKRWTCDLSEHELRVLSHALWVADSATNPLPGYADELDEAKASFLAEIEKT